MARTVKAGQLEWQLTGKDKSFGQALQGAEGKAKRFGGFMDKWAVGVAGAVAGAFAVKKIADFTVEMGKLGVQIETMRAKTEVVFGESAADVREWAEENAHQFGVTRDAAAGFITNMGDLMTGLGFASDEASALAIRFNELAGIQSLASGGTVSFAEASEILTAALKGEREALARLNLVLKQETVNQALAAKGLDDLTGNAKFQAEAIATLDELWAQSGRSLDLVNSGATDTAQKLNTITARWEEVKSAFATEIALPAMETALDWLDRLEQKLEEDIIPRLEESRAKLEEAFANENTAQDVSELGDRFGELKDALSEFGQELADLFGEENFEALVGRFTDDMIERATQAVEDMTSLFEGFTAALRGEWGEALGHWGDFIHGMLRPFRDFHRLIENSVMAFGRWLGQFTLVPLARLFDWVRGKLEGLVEFIRTIPQRVRDALGPMGGAASGLFGLFGAANGVTNWQGGPLIVGERGPEVVTLPRGSNVIPNHRLSGGGAMTGGTTINVTVQGSVLSERDLAAAITDTLRHGHRIGVG